MAAAALSPSLRKTVLKRRFALEGRHRANRSSVVFVASSTFELGLTHELLLVINSGMLVRLTDSQMGTPFTRRSNSGGAQPLLIAPLGRARK